MSVLSMRNNWLVAVWSLVILLLLTLGLYQQTVLYLLGLWNQLEMGEYAHGYLVLAISAYLIVRNRKTMSVLSPSPNYIAMLAVIASSMLWMVAVLVGVNVVQTVGLLLLVLSIVWLVLGNEVMRTLLFPILFIGFALPIWFPLSPLLQDLTADVVFGLMRGIGVPALREGNVIVVSAGKLSIEEACSGLRYLLAALTLGTLYAYLNYVTLRARVSVVLVSAAAAILANWLRVAIVVYLGHVTDMQHPLVHDHLSLGWYLFGGLVIVLLIVDAWLHRYQSSEKANSMSQKNNFRSFVDTKRERNYVVLVLAGILVVSVAPVTVYSVNHLPGADDKPDTVRLPEMIGDWHRGAAVEDSWKPIFHGAINHKHSYQKDDNSVILYVGYYHAQKQGEELINELNRISNKEIWRTRYPGPQLRSMGDWQILEQLLEHSNNKRRLVWYWYNIAGQFTTNKYAAKIYQLLGLLTGKREAMVVAVAIDIDDDLEHAREVLSKFTLVTIGESPLKTLP